MGALRAYTAAGRKIPRRALGPESGYGVPMNRWGADKTAVAEAAERAQAEYYRSVLAERRTELDLAIVKLAAEGRNVGPTVRQAQRDRRELDRMIAALNRRFPPADVTTPLRTPPRPDEIIHPDGRSLLSISEKRRSKNGASHRRQDKVS